MVAKFATLTEADGTHGAGKGLLTRVRVLMLLLVLGQTERLAAEATLDLFLRVMLFVVALQGKLRLESSVAAVKIALKDGRFPVFSCFAFLFVQSHAVYAAKLLSFRIFTRQV